jgi:hypothetical protein
MPPRGGKDRSVLADKVVNISEMDRNHFQDPSIFHSIQIID